ncbi:DUF6520 family protein [Myroides odoratus]|uniref:DUF6520 family protein n=1 Tax=Myroides odoratus TaxID=256 RepID=UPI00333E515A
MKKFFKTAAMPMAVFAIAIGSAFATNAMKNERMSVDAYQRMDTQGLVCQEKNEACEITGVEPCTWFDGSIEHPLYGLQKNALDQTVCTLKLYKI